MGLCIKVAHNRLSSVGFRSLSRVLEVSLQVTRVINPAVGCHYFSPGLQLPSQPLRGLLPVSLLGEQKHDGCEQLPKTVTRQRRGYDLNSGTSAPESSTLTTRLPSHPQCVQTVIRSGSCLLWSISKTAFYTTSDSRRLVYHTDRPVLSPARCRRVNSSATADSNHYGPNSIAWICCGFVELLFNNKSTSPQQIEVRYEVLFNVRSKSDISQVNLPHETNN